MAELERCLKLRDASIKWFWPCEWCVPCTKISATNLFAFLGHCQLATFHGIRVILEDDDSAVTYYWFLHAHRRGAGPALDLVCECEMNPSTLEVSMMLKDDGSMHFVQAVSLVAKIFKEHGQTNPVKTLSICPAPLANASTVVLDRCKLPSNWDDVFLAEQQMSQMLDLILHCPSLCFAILPELTDYGFAALICSHR